VENLFSQVTSCDWLSENEKQAMFALYSRHYSACNKRRFFDDLEEKDSVILLRNSSGLVCGFTTLLLIEFDFAGSHGRAIFSGDTVIHKDYWGTQALSLAWCRMAGMIKAQQPQLPLYWFLIVKGYRTYRYLPLFARRFYPSWRQQTPAATQALMDYLATQKFGNAYNPEPGIVRFQDSRGQLSDELAEIPAHVVNNRDVRFFLERNPDYAKGDELVCLTELDESNLRSFALKGFRDPIAS
jgi:hypothetical protein